MSPLATRHLENAAQIANLLSTPVRLKILQFVAQAPRSVESIAQATSESMPNVSQHLKKLLGSGLLQVEKKGLTRIYTLSDERLGVVIDQLFDLAETLSPRSPQSPSDESISTAFDDALLQSKILRKKAVLLDVRDTYESLTTPIDGSVRVPLSELPQMLNELSPNKEYYLICSGRACPKASAGVTLLRKRGFKAFRIKESPASIRLKTVKQKDL